jgi:hypothetical protein
VLSYTSLAKFCFAPGASTYSLSGVDVTYEIPLGAQNLAKLVHDARTETKKFCDARRDLSISLEGNFAIDVLALENKAFGERRPKSEGDSRISRAGVFLSIEPD